MAQRTIVTYTDDITGGEADGTVQFNFDGTDYEIDLNKENKEKFDKAVALYVEHGRKVTAGGTKQRRRRGSSERERMQDIRAWARQQGHQVSERGRIPKDITAEYNAAH